MGVLTRVAAGALALLLLGTGAGRAQDIPAGGDFLARARSAVDAFADPAAAAAAGYAPLGPEAPLMGAHWVKAALVADGVYDPGRPPVLVYASRPGGVALVGFAWALVVDGEESPPLPPAGATWHAHHGAVEDELLLHDHDTAAAAGEPRIAVFHAWVGLANPRGVFAPDNPALPWWRLGLAAPAGATDDAARAVSLISDPSWYGARLATLAGAPAGDDRLERAIARARAEVRVALGPALAAPAGPGGRTVEPATAAALGRIWAALRERARAIAPGADPAIGAVFGAD